MPEEGSSTPTVPNADAVVEVVSTGESVPSLGGASILILRVKKPKTGTGKNTVKLPKKFVALSILPSVRGTPTISENVLTMPSGIQSGDMFFIIGHY